MRKSFSGLIFGCFAAWPVLADDRCNEIAALAETIMEARQAGISLQQSYDTLSANLPVAAKESVKQIVIRAYDILRFTDPEIKRRSIEDFRDRIHVQCLKEVGSATTP